MQEFVHWYEKPKGTLEVSERLPSAGSHDAPREEVVVGGQGYQQEAEPW